MKGRAAPSLHESTIQKSKGATMSMLDVAKYLYYSKSIDLSPERDRYFSLSMANSGRLFSCLHVDRGRRGPPPACARTPVQESLPRCSIVRRGPPAERN